MKNLLTCDINRRIYMSNGTRQRCSKSRSAQSGAHPPPRACATSRGCRTLGSRVVGDQASSLSLSAACSATPATCPVQDAKVSFTVKLSRRLVATLRTYAASTGLTLSEIVGRAVQAILHRGGGRG